jgi:hypothetical protein
MTQLSLDLFLQASRDFESAQYRVLGGLQQTEEAFAQNTIYPHLARLIKLHGALQTVHQRLGDVDQAMKGDVKAVDWDEKKLLYEEPDLDPGDVEEVKALIRWALPRLEDTIEEGRALFEFVDENYEMEEVGLVPSYLQEGYLLVPARAAQELHIFRYTLSIFTEADERYRSLRTEHVKTMPQGRVDPSPQAVKLDLVEERRDLPNPATYFFETQLDFPFEETMLPVAKRKLMRYLSRQEGEA